MHTVIASQVVPVFQIQLVYFPVPVANKVSSSITFKDWQKVFFNESAGDPDGVLYVLHAILTVVVHPVPLVPF